MCRAVTCPVRGRARHRRPIIPFAARRAGGRADRRRAGPARGRGPRAAGARPGQGQPPAARVRRAGARAHRRAHDLAAARHSRRKRALLVSSPIGLGHAWRDVAIADELRRQVPGLEIQWLAQEPVTTVLRARGETIHPASAELASEAAHIDREAGEHDLHAFQAMRRMDEILCANFMVFDDLVREEQFDVWIGDEAWELDHFLHENPELKTAPYAWLTDFVGFLPMPAGGEHEAFLTADYNAEMIEHVERYPQRPRPLDLRRGARRHRARARSARACPRSARGPSATTSSRLHPGVRSGRAGRTARRCARSWATGRRAAVRRLGGRLRGRRAAAASA